MKTRPFRSGSSHELVQCGGGGRGAKIFLKKTESQHEDTTVELITTNLIETGALGQVFTTSGGNLAQKILPRTDFTASYKKLNHLSKICYKTYQKFHWQGVQTIL